LPKSKAKNIIERAKNAQNLAYIRISARKKVSRQGFRCQKLRLFRRAELAIRLDGHY